MTIRIVPTAEQHIDGFHAAIDLIARERRYIAFLQAPPLEQSQAFVRGLLAGAGVQFVAVDEADQVVGWCDIVRSALEGFRHNGKLGMGLLPDFRGQGLGYALATSTIAAARAEGMRRIELQVFASNTRAIRLYERIGFEREGLRRRARFLDGQYEDDVLMALLDTGV